MRNDILEREFFELEKSRVIHELNFFVLQIVKRFGEEYALKLLQANITFLNVLIKKNSDN